MKLPEKGDLVGEDAGPRPARYIIAIRTGDEPDDVRVGSARRGTRLTRWLNLTEFLKAYRWSEDHVLGGGWVPR